MTFPLGTVVTSNTDQIGSITGRLGYTWGPALLYAKGGYAWRNNDLTVAIAGVPQPFTASGNNKDGYSRRRRPGVHVRPQLVGQGRVPVL